jgi:hypothetical protein
MRSQKLRMRSRGLALSTVAFALTLLFPAGAWALDHFKVYEVEKIPVTFKVQLSDQLNLPLHDVKLEALTMFANATRKAHGNTQVGVRDANAHLTWYALTQPQVEPRRTIRFRNQFGQHSVDIKTPRFLLVPTEKTSDAGSVFPKSLDHYKCYEVIKVNTAPPPPAVVLRDQFGPKPQVQVGKPRYFCTPVRKVREGLPPVGIQNAKDHLAVYDLPPQPHAVAIKTRDQFGSRALKVIRSVMLAVPTEKQAAVAHPN